MKITIKRIETAEEMQAAHQIRKNVFVEEQGVSLREEIDKFEDESIHILASINGNPVGTARWRTTEKGLKLERFAVIKKYRTAGIGKTLLEFCLVENAHISHIYLNAQLTVIGFYQKYGFIEVGEEFSEAGIMHRQMEYFGI
ncbi:MAG: GNAT family N-acetyltransferase [Candidatus Marinimicrobia bacterium]|nr:GNAT family N-acetyltransferase [Candidatus Neomarinimicrobiota bacterium]